MPRCNHIRPASTAGMWGGSALREAASYSAVSFCKSPLVRICALSHKPLAQHAARQARMRDDLFDRTTNSLHSIEKALMNKVLLDDHTHQQHLGCHVGCLHRCIVMLDVYMRKSC